MEDITGTRNNEVPTPDALWNPLWHEARNAFDSFEEELEGPPAKQNVYAANSQMTIANFIGKRFVPDYVSAKKPSGRAHYQAMLRHVITPDEVDRVFQVTAVKPLVRLKKCPDWPYLSKVRLCDARPSHVEQLIAAAVARGYSTQTVTHIRNTVNAIFSYAKQACFLAGENPARFVRPPEVVREERQSLTLIELKEVLEAMQSPEREMALVALFTPMTMTEICALQWKYINLSASWSNVDGEPIPPRTIAVRKHWALGEFGNVAKSHKRDLPIHDFLSSVLLGLENRGTFTGPDDFVFVSDAGRALNHFDVKARRLKPLGKQTRMPWLSWHAFRHTRITLLSRFGTSFYDYMAEMPHAGCTIPTSTKAKSSAR
jgi:integrase